VARALAVGERLNHRPSSTIASRLVAEFDRALDIVPAAYDAGTASAVSER
jgi:hypothetical protein